MIAEYMHAVAVSWTLSQQEKILWKTSQTFSFYRNEDWQRWMMRWVDTTPIIISYPNSFKIVLSDHPIVASGMFIIEGRSNITAELFFFSCFDKNYWWMWDWRARLLSWCFNKKYFYMLLIYIILTIYNDK